MEGHGSYRPQPGAAAAPVRLRLLGDALEISADGATPVVWALRDIVPANIGEVRHRRQRKAILTIGDGSFYLALRARQPGLERATGFHRSGVVWLGLAGVVAALVFGAIVLPGLTLVPLVPWEAEQSFGEGVADSIGRRGGFCTGADGVAALRKLTARIEAVADLPVPLHVRVANRDEVNAFAAPGGHIVLLKGLIAEAESPDEVASVLAHEIGHVAHRDSTTALLRAVGTLVFMRAVLGQQDVGDIAQNMLNLSYSRAAERRADAMSAELLQRANGSPAGMPKFFARMARREEKEGLTPAYRSSHPATAERLKFFEEKAAAGAGRAATPLLTPAEWQALKGICSQTAPTTSR